MSRIPAGIWRERILPYPVAALCCYELIALAGFCPTISTRCRRLRPVLRAAVAFGMGAGLTVHLWRS